MATLKQKLAVKEIKLNPNNPRLIKDDKFKKLVQSLKDFPEMLDAREIVVNKDNIILGGNMRYRAAKEAGLTEVPVKVVDWPEDKQREFVIKDNISGGEWDWDILANEWSELPLDDWGVDLPATFGDQEIEEDEAPEVSSDPPVSKLGEIYQLGRHRVMCGDSTDFGQVSDLMDGKEADMVFTDPPYGMDYDPNMSDQLQNTKGKWKSKINNYDKVIGDDKPFDYSKFDWLGIKEQFWWGADYYAKTIPDGGSWFVWDKRVGIEDIKWSISEFELCWSKKRHHREVLRHRWFGLLGMENETDGKNGRVHPTQKPLELCGYFINKFSKLNDIILDLFLGSGSTLIACEQTNRICYGMEIDPKYVDVIRKRYWKLVNNNDESGWEENTPVVN